MRCIKRIQIKNARTIYVFLGLLVCLELMGSGHDTITDSKDIYKTTIVVKEGMNLVGQITSGGKGVEKVVISDGYSVTVTDINGVYQIKRNDSAKFVFVSVPENYKIPVSGNIPAFYTKLEQTQKIIYANFELEKKAIDSAFVLVAIADPQPGDMYELSRFSNETLPDVEKTKLDYNPNLNYYGIVLGDIVWNTPSLYPEYVKVMNSRLTFPFYHVIGNHDHDETVINNDYKASHNFEDNFGPTYYSYNIGQVHFVVLDDILFRERDDYDGTITPVQMNWLENDLKQVSKDKLIIMGLHISTKRRATSTTITNNQALYNLLSGYKVRILSGHTHTNFVTTISSTIEENTLGTACGAFWTGDINCDGTPNGYGVYYIEGNQISNWFYKGTKNSNDNQITLYEPGVWPALPTSVIANIWNWHSNWTIKVYQDGLYRSGMNQYYDYDPLAYSTMYGTSIPARHPVAAEPLKTDHLFYYNPIGTWSVIRIEATDGSGNIYSQSIHSKESLAQIVFFETFGMAVDNVNTTVESYSGWRNPTASFVGQNVDVRNTQHSCQVPTYLKGSGDGNIFFSGLDLATNTVPTESELLLKGINTSQFTNLNLQFGYRKHAVDQLPVFNISYSLDNGVNWNNLKYQFAEPIDTLVGWYQSPAISLPEQAQTTNLWLRFIKPSSNSAVNARIDDVKITGLNYFSTVPVALAATNVTPNGFVANWQAVDNAQKYILEVSDNANFSTNADSILAGWTFPSAYVTGTSPYANTGNAENIGISAITANSSGAFYSSTGPGGTIGSSYSLNSTGWDNGMFNKYYQVKICATAYRNLKLSSKSLSSANGPRYMTIQYKLGSSDVWLNVPNSDIDVYPGVAWNTTAILNDLALPSACDNQPELYIRWIVAGGVRADQTSQASAVTAGGSHRMTDIVIKGQKESSISGYEAKEVAGTSVALTSLSGTSYYYRVKAVDDKYHTNFSNVVYVYVNGLITLESANGSPDISVQILGNKIIVNHPSGLTGMARLIDMKGSVIFKEKLDDGEKSVLYFNGITKGVYVFIVQTAQGVKALKVIY